MNRLVLNQLHCEGFTVNGFTVSGRVPVGLYLQITEVIPTGRTFAFRSIGIHLFPTNVLVGTKLVNEEEMDHRSHRSCANAPWRLLYAHWAHWPKRSATVDKRGDFPLTIMGNERV